MKLKPQGRLEGSWLGRVLQSRTGVIASNWVFQGMRYMNIYEVVLKLTLDVLFVLLFVFLLVDDVNAVSLLAAFVAAHTVNWILNGHIFVLLRYVLPVPKTVEDFEMYIKTLQQRAMKTNCIDGVAIYGSYCRGQLHKYSDLDVRVIVRDGFFNGVCGALFCLRERFMAFFRSFPLDMYSCVGTRCLDRLRDDEMPVILLDQSGRLGDRYPAVEG